MSLPDEEHRRAVIHERSRNVIVDAGAGTGKTTLIVGRIVEMLAPSDDSVAPVGIDRIAAVTFTRRAAGELRLRIREHVLRELARAGGGSERGRLLLAALGGLDTAYVGTCHSFADRLLRLRPIEAGLSPSYEVVDDEEVLVQETATILIDGAQAGTLGEHLAGTVLEKQAAEASAIVLDALRAGILATSRELTYVTQHGLDGLVRGFVTHRDVEPRIPHARNFDFDAFRSAALEFCQGARCAKGPSAGERWLVRASKVLKRLATEDDPSLVCHELAQLARGPDQQKKSFEGNDEAYRAWQAFAGGPPKKPVRTPPLKEALLGPCQSWLASRLVRLFPVVVALYEGVKVRRRVLDQLDLLLKLRDLLRDDRTARGFYQGLFDRVFVDELQDTDPLQAEILMYLCEREPKAAVWSEVELAPGKLTNVGDPKQSIYRFRRADVAMYDEVRRLIAQGAHLDAPLVSNFRSRASLIAWGNNRFERILGRSPDGRLFDARRGLVFHRPLEAPHPEPATPRVHVVPLGIEGRAPDDEYRALEGEAVSRYLRWLVEVERPTIEDPLTKVERPVGFGDIAILAVSTYQLHLLLGPLDEMGIPHSTRGGRLFLEDPLTRQFLLGLRAIADREDGIGQAALLRPPFFAVDPGDLLRERAVRGEGTPDERSARAVEALRLVRELRTRRFERPPATTARELLERSAFGRVVALGPNGAQRLARLRELCFQLGRLATDEGLDYDGATARLRQWVNDPIALDPPAPVGDDAVQIVTVHQAKGLEYPVVVLWDGRGKWDTRPEAGPWAIARDGTNWVMRLHGLVWEHPQGGNLRERDEAYRDAERKRVIYVAATRARELLVIPRSGETKDTLVCHDLLEGAPAELVRELPTYVRGEGAPWAAAIQAPTPPVLRFDTATPASIGARWTAAVTGALRPLAVPVAISSGPTEIEEGPAAPSFERPSRFGAAFGTTVHRAIGLVLCNPSMSAADAVRTVVQSSVAVGDLAGRDAEAAEDVDRAVAALAAIGLRRPPDNALRLEYPVAGAGPDGAMLVGYADLVAMKDGVLYVLDFKTDSPPGPGGAAELPGYVAQVKTYGRLIAAAATSTKERCGLLFTADGGIRWCE